MNTMSPMAEQIAHLACRSVVDWHNSTESQQETPAHRIC